MSLARLVVTAVMVEGRTKAEVARDYGSRPGGSMSSAGVSTRKARPDSRLAQAGLRGSPHRTPEALEDEIGSASSGMTVLVATHDETVGSRSDKVIRIRDGRLE